MCGIVGFSSPSGAIERGTIKATLSKINHRGPDSSDTWLSPKYDYALGHARLSIIDLETGGQPLSNEDSSVICVVNGEFYGFKEIRRQLREKGHIFKTESDSEILPHLYDEHGLDLFSYLRGEFSFILIDLRRDLVLAARDRFGIKPLYYKAHNGGYAFASEVKCFSELGNGLSWDENAYAQSVAFGLAGGQTLFQDVFQVEPGGFVAIERGRMRCASYWNMAYQDERRLETSGALGKADLQREVLDAVKTRLTADVGVGCYLSGGLDSSLVYGLAAELSGAAPHAFTIKFADSRFDESAVAQRTANHFGGDITVIEIDDGSIVDHFEAAIFHREMVTKNANVVARYIQGKVAHEAGYKVVLTGDGADEVFGGYYDHRIEAVRTLAKQNYSSDLKRRNAFFINEVDDDAFRKQVGICVSTLGYTPAWLQFMHEIRHPLFKMLNIDGEKIDRLGARFFAQMNSRGFDNNPFNCSSYIFNKSILPNYILHCDRMDMAHGIESRLPLLDHKLFESARAVSIGSLMENFEEKKLLRDIARQHVTREVYDKPKHEFTAPHIQSAEKADRVGEYLRDTVTAANLKNIPMFDGISARDIDAVFSNSTAKASGTDSTLMMLVSTILMDRRLINQA